MDGIGVGLDGRSCYDENCLAQILMTWVYKDTSDQSRSLVGERVRIPGCSFWVFRAVAWVGSEFGEKCWVKMLWLFLVKLDADSFMSSVISY